MLLVPALGIGCSDPPSDDPPPEIEVADAGPAHSEPPSFVPDSFEALYPIFLLRKLAPGAKAALWRSYHGKYVRWTGTIISFTASGMTIKHIPKTVTFDVSLQMDAVGRARRKKLKVGDVVTYIGRLESYDDLFRTMYLQHGDVALPAAPAR